MTTFPLYWSWDNLGENLCMAWVDFDNSLKVSAFRGASARLSGRTMPAWDAPSTLETYCGDVNIGFYPQGSVYLGYTPQNSSLVNQPQVYRVSNAMGVPGSFGASSLLVTTTSGGLPSGNCGPILHSQSAGTGFDYFTHAGATLFAFSSVFGGHTATPFQSQTIDGSKWDWNKAGGGDGGEGADNIQNPMINPLKVLVAYEQTNMQAIAGSFPGWRSRPVRMADGTLAQLAFGRVYYKWRPCSPGIWSWDTGGTVSHFSQAISVPVPSGGTITEVALTIGYDFRTRALIPGTLATHNRPQSVTFAVPAIRASGTFDDPNVSADISFVNAKGLTVTIGNPTGAPVIPFGSFNLNGTARITPFPDNRAAINYWTQAGSGGFGLALGATDQATILAAAPGNVTLPITYQGTADSVTVNNVWLDMGPFEDFAPFAGGSFQGTWTWTTAIGGHSVNPGFPSFGGGTFGDFLPTTDPDFLADMQAGTGTNVATTLVLDTPGSTPSGGINTYDHGGTPTYPAPYWHFDFWHCSARFGYEDAAPQFRLLRSRDGGSHWEYAKDGAPITGLDVLRLGGELLGGPPLMPLLATNGSHLYIGWVTDSTPHLLVSADIGETWV